MGIVSESWGSHQVTVDEEWLLVAGEATVMPCGGEVKS